MSLFGTAGRLDSLPEQVGKCFRYKVKVTEKECRQVASKMNEAVSIYITAPSLACQYTHAHSNIYNYTIIYCIYRTGM